jgi:purine catabolism regulator
MLITLDDLLVLEPNLSRAAAGREWEGDAGEAEVTWAVSARTTSPHLPPLRGGEVLLVAPSVSEQIGPALAELYRHAADLGVRALVFERGDRGVDETYPTSDGPSLLIWHGSLGPETETTINRRLTESRSALYRLGSDLERRLADLAVAQSSLVALVAVVAETTDLPVAVTAGGGLCLAAAPADNPLCASDPPRDAPRVTGDLGFGATIALGPLSPDQQVTARFVVDRLAAAAAAALGRDEAARPRGSRRGQAIAELLGGGYGAAGEQRGAALALGLDPDANFVVAAARGVTVAALTQALAAHGTVHPASGADGYEVALVAMSRQRGAADLARQIMAIKSRWETRHASSDETLALSSPATGVADLPSSAREARFLASLQARGLLLGKAVSFESIDDQGAMRLLYQWRESSALREYVVANLGAIADQDKRGVLRATLRAFLASGGSQVDAAQRLGIHRNTLAYRLRRMSELLGRDVTNPATWLSLHLAVQAGDMFDAVAETP